MCNISETGMYLIDFALGENQSQLEINVGYYIKDKSKFVSVENVLGSILILKLFRAGFRDIREQTWQLNETITHHTQVFNTVFSFQSMVRAIWTLHVYYKFIICFTQIFFANLLVSHQSFTFSSTTTITITIFSSFEAMCWKNPQESYYG